MSRIFLIGAGGFSKQVIDIYKSRNVNIMGIFDNFKSGLFYRNVPILGRIESIKNTIPKDENVFITFGDSITRENIYNEFNNRYNYPNCIDKSAHIGCESKIGIGNYIGVKTVIGEESYIGNFNFINNLTLTSHDSKIGNFNHLAPSTILLGNSSIGNANFFGAGCIIIPKVSISDNNIFGAASLINKNITERGTYVGAPVKKIK